MKYQKTKAANQPMTSFNVTFLLSSLAFFLESELRKMKLLSATALL